ncbi:hypothetical protein [Hahella ganghwensis]|uniref:hypothetical protein n=1 Tax=Hahella ganghwensis TaxID=286420 RepID=UPI00038038F9|nr:hypothetical protein [Hahella ganghwensis]
MPQLDSLPIPMTMGDWVLIMESIDAKLKIMASVDPDSIDEDDLADMYTDQQNLEGILSHIKSEFEKEYGALPPHLGN